MLDAQAEYYIARPLDAPRTSATATLAVEARPDARTTGLGPATALAIEAGPAVKTAGLGPAPASDPVPPALPTVTAPPDVRDVVRDEPQGDVTGAITQRGTARFATIYIHRGAEPPAAYVVPRE